MNTYALINNGIVTNMAIWDGVSEWNPGCQIVEVTNLTCNDGSPIQIGCTYDGTNFYPPPGD
jgi:hypothetical protein